jgi:Alpha-glucuronidase
MQRLKKQPGILPAILLSFITVACIPCLFAQKKDSKKKMKPNIGQKIVLAENKSSQYKIVLPKHATTYELRAATVLQDYLIQVSGAALPIVTSDKSPKSQEIIIGQNERLDELAAAIDYRLLKEDGFVIWTDSTRLIIAGGSEKGSLYGVYSFLEQYLGCRMYSPKVKIIPHQNTVILGKINDRQVPVITFRDTHYRTTWDAEYTDWHKLDHAPDGERTDWGMWVHTFNELVPPQVYYSSHPEYFAMVKGKRLPTQLCLSNPEVLQITIQNLRKKIAMNPAAKYWSVSQNDNRDYCTCDPCKGLDAREGSPSGSIINFVNQVADQFPGKMISTLAYEYGRHAPKTMKPRDNVNIMLCSIEAFRDKPIRADESSAEFVKDVKDWSKIAKDIIVWDYVIQFNHLLSPFPNLHVLQPNIQFFAENNVNAMFEQGNREVGGEFAALRAYLISKLLWNPWVNVDSVMNDFLFGYYGAAGTPIRKYIDLMRGELIKGGKPLRIFGSPNEAADTYLTPALIAKYNSLFDEAEKLVADSAEVLERVRIARLPLMYATMEQAKKNFTGENGLFEKVNDKWEAKTNIRNMVDEFTDLCLREGVTQVKEWSTSPEAYRSAMYRLYSQGMNEHLAYGKKVMMISPDTSDISEEKLKMLTDGKRGSHDYDNNWINFAGKDLEVVIDLEKKEVVRKIGSGYYQLGFWLRLLPKNVEYYTSLDGKNFELAGNVVNTLPIDQYGGYLREFNIEFVPRDARYIKVHARSIGNTPGWHPGAGRPSHMLIDEIVVE